ARAEHERDDREPPDEEPDAAPLGLQQDRFLVAIDVRLEDLIVALAGEHLPTDVPLDRTRRLRGQVADRDDVAALGTAELRCDVVHALIDAAVTTGWPRGPHDCRDDDECEQQPDPFPPSRLVDHFAHAARASESICSRRPIDDGPYWKSTIVPSGEIANVSGCPRTPNARTAS